MGCVDHGLGGDVERNKDGFESLVTQNHQGGHRPQTARQRFVAAGVADAAHDLLVREVSSDHKRLGGGRSIIGFAGGMRGPEQQRRGR